MIIVRYNVNLIIIMSLYKGEKVLFYVDLP